MKKLIVPLILIMSLLPMISSAQYLRLEDPQRLTLSDSSKLILVNRRDGLNQYYYFPINLRLANKKDGTPEISFLGIKESAEDSERKYSGGILHFLLTWGLDASQMDEADSLLKADINPKGAIWGAVPLLHIKGGDQPLLKAETENDYVEILEQHLKSRAAIPTYPGGKWAASCKFEGEEAEKMEAALKDEHLWGKAEISFSWYLEGSQRRISLTASLNRIFKLEKDN